MSSPGYTTPDSPPAGPAGSAHDGSAALIEALIGQPVGRLEYRDALVRFERAAAELNGLGVDTLTPIDMLAVLERREAVRRAEAIIDHRIIARLAAETNPRELGAKSLPELLSTRLRISRYEARRRIEDTRAFGLRRALSGEPLQPRAPHTAAHLVDGSIGPEHCAIIRDFIAHIPKNKVGVDELDRAETQLADIAADYTPEQTRRFAGRLMCTLNPDGEFSDAERRRKRGVHIGKQDFTGMSPLSGSLTPECRAVFEAIFAKLAAPGMCNPESRSPCVDGTPNAEQIGADRREQAQRNHDALLTVGRAMLASGQLGQHNGLPVTVVLTATLQDLHAASGYAITGGGTLVPMSDMIRMARHSYHYLAVFDKPTNIPLYLGRAKRIATPGQRLVLFARDLGCTFPGCPSPGYYCEVHHFDGWHGDGLTDIINEGLACPGNHAMVVEGPCGWTARLGSDGTVEWIPPPHLDTGGPRTNTYHHPERLLTRLRRRPRPNTGPRLNC